MPARQPPSKSLPPTQERKGGVGGGRSAPDKGKGASPTGTFPPGKAARVRHGPSLRPEAGEQPPPCGVRPARPAALTGPAAPSGHRHAACTYLSRAGTSVFSFPFFRIEPGRAAQKISSVSPPPSLRGDGGILWRMKGTSPPQTALAAGGFRPGPFLKGEAGRGAFPRRADAEKIMKRPSPSGRIPPGRRRLTIAFHILFSLRKEAPKKGKDKKICL